jgi:hypothetical protein
MIGMARDSSTACAARNRAARNAFAGIAADKARTSNSGAARARGAGCTKKAKRRFWTKRDLATVLRLYPDMDTKALAEKMNRSVVSIYQRAQIAGIGKSAAYDARKKAAEADRLKRNGIAYRYSKGHVPANAGLRRPGYAPGRMAETQFKKGRPVSAARNYKPIGSYRINADGYLDRKLSDTGLPQRRWACVHRLVWIAAHGPIPPGHAVAFKAGRATTDVAKITLDAVELITRGQLMLRNSYHANYPKEIRQLIQLRGALQRQINKRVKKQGERPSTIK